MVAISKSIATKIKDKQGDVTDDEVGICENVFEFNQYRTCNGFKLYFALKDLNVYTYQF